MRKREARDDEMRGAARSQLRSGREWRRDEERNGMREERMGKEVREVEVAGIPWALRREERKGTERNGTERSGAERSGAERSGTDRIG